MHTEPSGVDAEAVVHEEPTSKRWTAAALYSAISTRYAPPEWATFPQMRNGTGFTATRTLDAITMNMYPSRGLAVIGFEIKISRSDWLRELKKPEKADDTFGYLDRFFVVAPKDIVRPDELPLGWGLLVPHGDTLRIVVDSPARTNVTPLDRAFIAAILRQAREATMKLADQDALDAAYEQGKKTALKDQKFDFAKVESQRDRALGIIREFEDASGLSLTSWQAREIGRKVAALGTQPGDVLRDLAFRADGLVKHLRETLEKMDGVPEQIRAAANQMSLKPQGDEAGGGA